MRRALTSPVIALLGLGALTLAPRPAGAQNLSFDVGPMVGPVFATWHGADVAGSGTKFRTSLVVGGFATIGINKHFAIEPQLLYAQKGTGIDVGGGIAGTFKQPFIEIPVLLKGVFPIPGTTRLAPQVFAGPAIAFQTACNLKASSGGATVEVPCDSLFSGSGASTKSTDFIFVFGGGLDVGPIALQVRYDLGLSKVFDASAALDVKSEAWLVTAGYRLPLK
jgi:Outer membrane protein beta-barrel domain